MTGHGLGAGVNFDAGNNPCIRQDLDKGSAIFFLLADRLVVENCATNALTKSGRGYDHFAIGAPGFHRLRNTQLRKTLVAGGIAFIHSEQSLVIGYKCPRRIVECLCIHL